MWERVNRKLSLGGDFRGEAGQREKTEVQGFQAQAAWAIHLCVPEELHEGMWAGRRVWLGGSERGQSRHVEGRIITEWRQFRAVQVGGRTWFLLWKSVEVSSR